VSHTDEFNEFRARREAERRARVKVTWRKVDELTGGGYSGYGPAGALVYIVLSNDSWEFGRFAGKRRIRVGTARTRKLAKELATEILHINSAEEGRKPC
jgi:hypothetical protein